ncbi:MAG: HDIG domain-containing protein [candidate division NC10 bacterium]|nr:HDIG domain-containing protein [candidate division NC10 bacterium]
MDPLRFFRKGNKRGAIPSRAQRLRFYPDLPKEGRGILLLGAAFFLLVLTGLVISAHPRPWQISKLLGLFLLVLFLVGSLYYYLIKLQPRPLQSTKSLLLLATVILLCLSIVRFTFLLITSLNNTFPFFPLASLKYSLPVALGGFLLAVVFNPRLAFAGSLAISILATFMVSGEFRFFLFSFVGGLVGAFAVSDSQEQATFFKAGLLISLINLYTISALALISSGGADLPYDVLASLTNGLFIAILASGLLPALEYFFDTTSYFKLLELSNLHQPVLKQLVLVAPGTYHHSILVGTLAEGAAEAIGANPLLVRVGAYYHDIGKIKKPSYFIENQMDALNRHDKLAPSMSSLIIISHVKEGLELALEHHLPPALVDIIHQHHGTSLIAYFYQKAKEAEDRELGEVKEEEYRYPGPKPETKEAAVLMLADAVEAASRTLTDPTPARIQGLVQRIINNIFIDGQLGECDLTLRDLHLIAKSFVRILMGIFHSRIDYPEMRFQDFPRKREGNGPPGQKSTKEDKNQYSPLKKGGAEDLKRLGI